MRRWRRPAIRLGVVVTCSTLLTLTGPSVQASGPTVTGAGSTWVQPALDTWRADIQRQGLTINYQGVGSSAGRNFYIINQVDFAATEIPFQPDEVQQLQGEHKSYQYLPDVAGATTLMYDLHTPSGSPITSLRLDAVTAAKIFTGVITSWHDPAVKALNPSLSIKEDTVIPVTRSDGSGTSAQFSLYLADQASGEWNTFVTNYGCPAPCSQWPQFPGTIQANGSDQVANFVANGALGSGAIGYVEAAFAFGRGFPVAAMRNGGGSYVQLTLGNTAADVAVALTHATLHPDLTQDLTAVYRATESNAYPMSSYSYMVTQTTGFDPAKGAVLGQWLIYIACAGQQEAAPLGYSPLPPNLVRAVFEAVGRIPGAPATPPIDRDHCANPTVTNAGAGGGTATSTSSSTASSGSSTAAAGGTGGSSSGRPGSATAGSGTPQGAQGTAGTTQGVAGAAGGGAVALAPQGGVTGATGVAASQGGAPGANAAAGGIQDTVGTGPQRVLLPSGVTLETLSDAQRQTMLAQAMQTASDAQSPPTRPMFLAAALIGALIGGPMLPMGRRRKPPAAAGSSHP